MTTKMQTLSRPTSLSTSVLLFHVIKTRIAQGLKLYFILATTPDSQVLVNDCYSTPGCYVVCGKSFCLKCDIKRTFDLSNDAEVCAAKNTNENAYGSHWAVSKTTRQHDRTPRMPKHFLGGSENFFFLFYTSNQTQPKKSQATPKKVWYSNYAQGITEDSRRQYFLNNTRKLVIRMFSMSFLNSNKKYLLALVYGLCLCHRQ